MQCTVILTISILFVISQAAPTSDSYEDDMQKRKLIALECIEKVKIDRKIIEKAIENPTKLVDDPKYKEFLTCSYKKQHFQSEDGKMLYDNIYDFLTRFYKRSELTALDVCKNVTAANDAEMAYNSLKCIITGLRELDANETENL